MNELDDLLEILDVPPTDPTADVARGERSLRRRRRTQVSAAVLSVVAALGLALGSSSRSPGPVGFAGGTSTASSSEPDQTQVAQQQVERMERRLLRRAVHDQRDTYRKVLVAHLDPGGGRLGPVNGEQGGSGTYGTKFDWNHGGMLEIVLSRSWLGAGHFYALEDAGMAPTSYVGHPAQVSTTGDDVVVSVRHRNGIIVTLIASTSFGNNGTTTSAIGLTQAQLLDAAADPALNLPPWVAP